MVLDTSGLNGKAIEVSKYCFLVHLSHSDKVSFCDQSSSIVCIHLT